MMARRPASAPSFKTLKDYRNDLVAAGVSEVPGKLQHWLQSQKSRVPMATIAKECDKALGSFVSFVLSTQTQNGEDTVDLLQHSTNLKNLRVIITQMGSKAKENAEAIEKEKFRSANFDSNTDMLYHSLKEQSALYHSCFGNNDAHREKYENFHSPVSLEPGTVWAQDRGLDDCVVEYLMADDRLDRFRRSDFSAPAPSGAFCTDMPHSRVMAIKVTDELQSVRTRSFWLALAATARAKREQKMANSVTSSKPVQNRGQFATSQILGAQRCQGLMGSQPDCPKVLSTARSNDGRPVSAISPHAASVRIGSKMLSKHQIRPSTART